MSAVLDPRKHLPWRAACAGCGRVLDLADLDGKPEPTVWLRLVQLLRGQRSMLRYASDHGHDFTRLECAGCYGPGFVAAPVEAHQ